LEENAHVDVKPLYHADTVTTECAK